MATFHAMGYYYNDHIPSKKQATADAFMFGDYDGYEVYEEAVPSSPLF